MNERDTALGEVVLYRSGDGESALEVHLEKETVWLSQRQMSELFDKDVKTVNEHVRNVFSEGELEAGSTIRKFRIVQKEGARQVARTIDHYNLDVIISVGYRVKSKRGTQFRQWATRVLREHLVHGFTVNEQRLREQAEKLTDLRSAVALLEKTLAHQPVGLDEAKGLLQVVADYTYALTTLDRYDHGTLAVEETTEATPYRMTHGDALALVNAMSGEFNGLFGVEKDQGLDSAIGAIYQTFGGADLYPSIEEKAANLLYLVTKNHAFVDGNKRIAAAIFLTFLAGSGILYRPDGSKRLADNALVAVTLLIAESAPEEKDTIVKVVVNLINRSND
ncbi:MAG TPA: virulence protein RhuM/Fic/DOC family protein [Deferrisomatales bacterium]|nr:virulence protein RhuM/Fic/DOC family protein [Deferrisomatales bacterium]